MSSFFSRIHCLLRACCYGGVGRTDDSDLKMGGGHIKIGSDVCFLRNWLGGGTSISDSLGLPGMGM